MKWFFPDGEGSEYGANVLAENMWAQCDLDGNQQLLLDVIVDQRIDDGAVKLVDAFCVSQWAPLSQENDAWSLVCPMDERILFMGAPG
jgi:hypothetical protein